MQAYILLAKLRILKLVGFENGELQWIGSDSDWKMLALEEESILRDYQLSKI